MAAVPAGASASSEGLGLCQAVAAKDSQQINGILKQCLAGVVAREGEGRCTLTVADAEGKRRTLVLSPERAALYARQLAAARAPRLQSEELAALAANRRNLQTAVVHALALRMRSGFQPGPAGATAVAALRQSLGIATTETMRQVEGTMAEERWRCEAEGRPLPLKPAVMVGGLAGMVGRTLAQEAGVEVKLGHNFLYYSAIPIPNQAAQAGQQQGAQTAPSAAFREAGSRGRPQAPAQPPGAQTRRSMTGSESSNDDDTSGNESSSDGESARGEEQEGRRPPGRAAGPQGAQQQAPAAPAAAPVAREFASSESESETDVPLAKRHKVIQGYQVQLMWAMGDLAGVTLSGRPFRRARVCEAWVEARAALMEMYGVGALHASPAVAESACPTCTVANAPSNACVGVHSLLGEMLGRAPPPVRAFPHLASAACMDLVPPEAVALMLAARQRSKEWDDSSWQQARPEEHEVFERAVRRLSAAAATMRQEPQRRPEVKVLMALLQQQQSPWSPYGFKGRVAEPAVVSRLQAAMLQQLKEREGPAQPRKARGKKTAGAEHEAAEAGDEAGRLRGAGPKGAADGGLALLLALAGSAAALPTWYNCDASNCQAPSCHCASTNIPGGLKPENTPQFLVITHDDAINDISNSAIRGITGKLKNPNGCQAGFAAATWFTIKNGTDCKLAKSLFNDGHEIAMHTLDHYKTGPTFNPPAWNSKVSLETEMIGVRDWLAGSCDIPSDLIVGFRQRRSRGLGPGAGGGRGSGATGPFLAYGPKNREILHKYGALYDSTMVEHWPSSTSPAANSKVWPFTMDNGIPTDCTYFGADTVCNQTTEKYPGLWEVPLYQLEDTRGTPLYSMDPAGDVYKVLRDNFDPIYSGNRAPIGLYVHAPWATPTNQAAATKFFQYALGKGDVWIVTIHQLIQWMQNPVPKDKMNDWFKCAAGGVVSGQSLATPPNLAANNDSPSVSPLDVGAVSVAAPAAAPAAADGASAAANGDTTLQQAETEAPAAPADVHITVGAPAAGGSGGSGGLSTGAIIGIAAGGAAGLALAAGLAVYIFKSKAAAAAAAGGHGAAAGRSGVLATVSTSAEPKVATMA
eukprot:scaffold12.g8201.t1